MYQEYLDKVIKTIYETTFTLKEKDGSKRLINDYEEGMSWLVKQFLIVKEAGGKVFFIGNGGSAAIASHMTADFMKNGRMKTYSLYDNAVITCMGNDYGYEYVFSKTLDFLLEEGDLLVAISSSGNSQNIINAVDVADRKKAKVVTLSGFGVDNKIYARGEVNVHVPISEYGVVESVHNLILQQVVDEILKRDKERGT